MLTAVDDSVQLVVDRPYKASLNTEDPLYQDKRMVAQRNGKLAVQVFHVYVVKEKEAVSDTLPYLRLGYVTDPSEMQSVISSQGPICLVEIIIPHSGKGYFSEVG